MNNTLFYSFLSIFLIFTATSCKKKDSNPEKSDVIYTDLLSEVEIARKNLEDEKKQNERVKKELLEVVPQTGQVKNAQKRVFESENNIQTYSQQLRYLEIKAEQRKHYVHQRYEESLRPGGREWPDIKENEDYAIRMKLQREKLNWGKDKPKDPPKKENVPRGTQKEPAATAQSH